MSQRKLRVGMVGGGGPANFFGAPHRRAILMDNSAELTAGALRSKPDESIASARELFMPRGYPDWETMIKSEAGSARVGADRLRHDRHAQRRPFRPGRRRRGRGDRRALRKAADDHARRSAPPPRHGPLQECPVRRRLHLHRLPDGDAGPRAGAPAARSARSARSRPGIPRGGWPPSSRPTTRSRPRGGSIRPRRAVRAAAAISAPTLMSSSGSSPGCRRSGCGPGSKTFVPGRALDDDFTVLAELNNGGIATITASQVTIGAQNDNGFRVIGTTGTLEWSITDHTVLKHYAGGQPLKLYRQGAEYGYFPGLDQAVSPPPLRPSGRLSRGARQPAPNARMDDPRRPGRDGPQAVRAPRDRRRRRRHGLHRGRRRQLEAGRRVGRGPQGRLRSRARPLAARTRLPEENAP